MERFIRKGIAVSACALIGAGFGYSQQNGERNDAQGRANTIEACTRNVPNAVVTRAVATCVESGATGHVVDSDDVHVGEPMTELQAYAASQEDYADSIDGGQIARDAAIGAVVGLFCIG